MAQINPSELSNYLNRKLKSAESSTLSKWKIQSIPLAKNEINKRLDKGISPVAGFGKFIKYTAEYAKRMGRSRLPVTLVGKTRRMRRSLVGKKTRAGISLFYTSPIAKYHNGEGRVYRPLLPRDGQKFKRGIKSALSKLYLKLFKI